MLNTLVLLSGGLDSTVALHWAREHSNVLACLSVDYDQRHRVELVQAARIAEQLNIPFVQQSVVGLLGGTAGRSAIHTAADAVTPMRNLTLLTTAARLAHELGATSIVSGFCAADAADFPDCRPAFVRAATDAISLSLGYSMKVICPLIGASKIQTLHLATTLRGCWEMLGQTWSCYSPALVPGTRQYSACSICPACTTRSAAFRDFGGRVDPAAGLLVAA
jgi:7-cyano-7-deazaguanine synthase